MLPIKVKEYIRAFLKEQLAISKSKMLRVGFGVIIIKEQELEDFLDSLWLEINQKKVEEEKDQ